MPERTPLPKQHFERTKQLVDQLQTDDIGRWLLTKGYYPEAYVLPPSFVVDRFELNTEPFWKAEKKENGSSRAIDTSQKWLSLGYPKNSLTDRTFSIIHPHLLHDIVFYLMQGWANVKKILFSDQIRVYSYSCPVPVDANTPGRLGGLRAGRMIYEWISMAERDLLAEAHRYKFLIKADVARFYDSIYSHSIDWALQEESEKTRDRDNDRLGSKIDQLFQYSNDKKTTGIPTGPAISDLIAEVLLTNVDKEFSQTVQVKDFVATRFKDDYRFLCQNEKDAHDILKSLAGSLSKYNLTLNEPKTQLSKLPEGLYRKHIAEYDALALPSRKNVTLAEFEKAVFPVLEISNRYPGTNILEKLIRNFLFDDEHNLKLIPNRRKGGCPQNSDKSGAWKIDELRRIVSLLFLIQRQSMKNLGNVLAVCEELILQTELIQTFPRPLKKN